MTLVFLDTNVLVRHLTNDHAEHSPKATAYLARIENGNVRVRTEDTAIFEAVFLLERRYRHSKADIREGLLSIIELPSVELPNKHRLRRVFDLYVEANMSFVDAYHVAVMEQLSIEEIASFDRDFDRVPGITRVEPN